MKIPSPEMVCEGHALWFPAFLLNQENLGFHELEGQSRCRITLNVPDRSINRGMSHPKGTPFAGEKRISIVSKGRPQAHWALSLRKKYALTGLSMSV